MANLTGKERADYVQEMFTGIARRYDLMNRMMTAGQDVRWRREVIHRTHLPDGGRLLDLGAGTGDLARETRRQHPNSQVLAADFTLEMMRVGKRHMGEHLNHQPEAWLAADALSLPFLSNTFDAVVSGFLMRNVTDITRCAREQFRVLKPGGRIVILDTTPPPRSALAPFIRLHLHYVIPTLGKLVAGNADAYNYLPDSTEGFLEAERLAARLIEAGFQAVGFQRRMFGTIAIHWGLKPA